MQLVNRRADATATIELDGGRLASLAVHGHELLVGRAEKATRWGSFPMIPWCGRLPFGRLSFGGHDYEFPLNSPPHANHGIIENEPHRVAFSARPTSSSWPCTASDAIRPPSSSTVAVALARRFTSCIARL